MRKGDLVLVTFEIFKTNKLKNNVELVDK